MFQLGGAQACIPEATQQATRGEDHLHLHDCRSRG